MTQEDEVKECCLNADNLQESKLSEDLTVQTCRECGCRHFLLTADPLTVGMTWA